MNDLRQKSIDAVKHNINFCITGKYFDEQDCCALGAIFENPGRFEQLFGPLYELNETEITALLKMKFEDPNSIESNRFCLDNFGLNHNELKHIQELNDLWKLNDLEQYLEKLSVTS